MLALLVLLVLGTLGTGLLFVSTQEARVAAALLHTVRARAGAESAVRAALVGWRTSAYRALEPGAPRAAPGAAGTLAPDVAYDARVERLAAGLFLIRGEARSGPEAGPGARASVGLLVRGLLPADFTPDLAAALSAAGPVEVLPGGVVDGTGAARPPEGRGPDLCPPDSVLGLPPGPRPGVLLPENTPAPVGAVQGVPPVARDPGLANLTALAGLGPLGLADLAALADRTEAGAIAAAPRTAAGECDTSAPGNWGDPADPAAPCGGYLPLIFAPADLALSGAGQGVLVVQGDLALEPGAAFHGAVLVTGRITVAAGAVVSGAVRAGRASVAGAIRFDACALGRALGSAPGLDRPLRPAGRSWVPVF
ncbi:MAG TPA: polymer-forming cytoskeletal protein [Longimicrobiales bacterium]